MELYYPFSLRGRERVFMAPMRETIKNLRYLQLSDTTTVWQRRLPSHYTADFQKMQSRRQVGLLGALTKLGGKWRLACQSSWGQGYLNRARLLEYNLGAAIV